MKKSDYAHKWTDKQLAALEKRIAAEFKQAAEELTDTVNAYFAALKKRDAEMAAKVEAGEITEQQYKQWRLAQIGRGKRFEALRDKVAERYTNAHEVAVAYANDATPGIYTLNRNYVAYTIEQVSDKADFTLWDEQTVRRLIEEQPGLMPYYPPKRALKRGIDLDYGKKQITASITSSILQGKGIDKISSDLQNRMHGMSLASAIRTARTATTAAQNAGRMDSYHAAEGMGIKLKKEWLATLDGRTRHAHAMLDGQTAETDKPFHVDGYEIMYPGDTSAPGYLVYNCRCTLIAALDDVPKTPNPLRRARDPETGRSIIVSDMTYAQWESWKERAKKLASAPKCSILKKVGTQARKYILTQTQTIEMAKELAHSAEYEKASSLQALRAITNRKLGYDGPPIVAKTSEFDQLAASKIRLYRGVKSNGNKTADEIVSEFKRGQLWTGNSGGAAFGNGVYFTSTKEIAQGDYAGQNGALIEAVLNDTAIVADYKTIYQEFWDTGIPRAIKGKEDYQLILGDVGQYAAVKGYDAIALNGFQGHDYVILLNRTKAIVRD